MKITIRLETDGSDDEAEAFDRVHALFKEWSQHLIQDERSPITIAVIEQAIGASVKQEPAP